MTDLSEMGDIGTFLRKLIKDGHTAEVLWLTTNLENMLERILKYQLPNLSNNLSKNLFEGYGPFSHFSTKIDVLYAMGKISEDLKRDLHAIREIRNEFAHQSSRLSFEHEEVLKLMKKFPDYKEKQHKPVAILFFTNKIDDCFKQLKNIIENIYLVESLSSRAKKKAEASQKNSS